MESIKTFFKNTWFTVTTVLGIIITILGLLLFFKNRKIADIIADLTQAKTNEQVLNLEKEIVAINTRKDLNSEEIEELNQALVLLAKKKQELIDKQKDTTIQDNLDYWNK